MFQIQEPLSFVFSQLTQIWLLQTVSKWQESWTQRVSEQSVSLPKSILWTREPTPSAWLREKTCRWDLDLSASRTGHNRTLSIESPSRQPLRRSSCTSEHIQSTLPCHRTCLVLAIWPRSWRRSCSRTSSIVCQRSWRKSETNKRLLRKILRIWDQRCRMRMRLRLNCYGQWSPISSKPTKTLFQVDLTPEEPCPETKTDLNFQEEQRLNWTFTTFIKSLNNSEPPLIIMIWQSKRLFKCTREMVYQVSHRLTFSFIWSILNLRS